jgi:hypothetical protein
MKGILFIIGGLLLVISVISYFAVRIYLKPDFDEELDDYYFELEEQHPGYAAYLKWSRTAFGGITVAVLLIFLAAII